MNSIRVNLIVIRSLDPRRTVDFYESLGIHFQEEQHGRGPVHWAADLDGLVLEVYPAQAADAVADCTRLGFDVEDVKAVLASLRNQCAEVVSDLQQTQWGLRAVVKDPDGRSVEVVQVRVE